MAVRETRAWTMSEILEVLHEREEGDWMRLGRLRSVQVERLERRAVGQTKPAGRKRPPAHRG